MNEQEDIEDQFEFVYGGVDQKQDNKNSDKKKKAIKKKKRVELLMENDESEMEGEILNS